MAPPVQRSADVPFHAEADLRDAIADANDLGHFFLLMEQGLRDPPRQPAGFPIARAGVFHVSGTQKRSIFGRKTSSAPSRAISQRLKPVSDRRSPRPKPQPYRPHSQYKGFAPVLPLLLSAWPHRKRQYPPRMTPHLRREIMKAETYKARLKFLQENGISTADDLTTCMQRAENAVTQLAKQRTILNVRKKNARSSFDALATEESLAVSKAPMKKVSPAWNLSTSSTRKESGTGRLWFFTADPSQKKKQTSTSSFAQLN